MSELTPFWLSLRVALTAMMLVVPLGLPAAWWLARGRASSAKVFIETLLSLPLVLPPTVVGFALLMLLGNGTAVGRWLNESAGVSLLFTWQGATVASAVMALPLFVLTCSAALATVSPALLEAGRMEGAREWHLFWQITIPISYRGLLAGLSLAFARALGEFGATLMVAGSIPGRTQTLPLALYAAVQAGRNHDALVYSAILLALAFFTLGVLATYRNRVAGVREG